MISEGASSRGPRSAARAAAPARVVADVARLTVPAALRAALFEKAARDAEDFVEPDRLEQDFGVQIVHFLQRRVVDAGIAGDDCDRDVLVRLVRAQTIQESNTVDEWHAQIEQNR